MKVAIIENSNMTSLAEFMVDENGDRRLFPTHADADMWLCDNAEPGVAYLQFDGDQ